MSGFPATKKEAELARRLGDAGIEVWWAVRSPITLTGMRHTPDQELYADLSDVALNVSSGPYASRKQMFDALTAKFPGQFSPYDDGKALGAFVSDLTPEALEFIIGFYRNGHEPLAI